MRHKVSVLVKGAHLCAPLRAELSSNPGTYCSLRNASSQLSLSVLMSHVLAPMMHGRESSTTIGKSSVRALRAKAKIRNRKRRCAFRSGSLHLHRSNIRAHWTRTQEQPRKPEFC
mmetsp:Transcript_3450/g.9436  ORF Transcript_3450/g.9436 Transcript_3450/m.9436 type:complete len:115 (-) Transcript_3450:661-1005(-)